jgi:two-component system, LytTR family, response regulator
MIAISNIIRIEAISNYSKLFFANDATASVGRNTLVVAKVLKWFEERLPYENFTRLHRSHLVNNQFIQTHQCSSKAFELQNGKVIEISRRKRKSVMRKFLLPQQCHFPIVTEVLASNQLAS